MGYRVPQGQDNYLPKSFLSAFQELHSSPPEIVRSPADILQLIVRARETFAKRGVKIRQGSTLDRLFANASSSLRGSRKVSARGEVELHTVARLGALVVAFADEPGLKVCLERIAGSDVAASSRRQSPGKDAIWELTSLSHLRMSKITSRLAEPDLVAEFGFGEYGVACKKIYSENSVEKAIKKGVAQLRGAELRGLVSLNLDDLIVPANRVLYASSQDFLRHMLTEYISKFVERHRVSLERYAGGDYCDGYIIYLESVGILLNRGEFVPLAVKLIYIPDEAPAPAKERLVALTEKLEQAEGLGDWVAHAGGKTKNW